MMLLQELQETSPPRDDGVPVEVRMAAVVMGFDLLHVNGLPYAHHLVQILAIPSSVGESATDRTLHLK